MCGTKSRHYIAFSCPLGQKGPLLLPSITEQIFFALRTGELGLVAGSRTDGDRVSAAARVFIRLST